MALWEGLRKQDVIAPIVGSGGARMLLRLVGHTLGLPGVGLASLLDPSPLAGEASSAGSTGSASKTT